MSQQRIHNRLLAQVPHTNVIVNAACEDLISGRRHGHRRDGEVGLDIVDGVFTARVPDANGGIIAAADDQVLAASGDIYSVDDFLVPDVSPYPRAGCQVPAGKVHVRRCSVQYFRVPRPLEVENGALVPV